MAAVILKLIAGELKAFREAMPLAVEIEKRWGRETARRIGIASERINRVLTGAIWCMRGGEVDCSGMVQRQQRQASVVRRRGEPVRQAARLTAGSPIVAPGRQYIVAEQDSLRRRRHQGRIGMIDGHEIFRAWPHVPVM